LITRGLEISRFGDFGFEIIDVEATSSKVAQASNMAAEI
jgi:hypothetical protein